MEELNQEALRKRYMDALDSFIDKIRDDPNVIAVIISGSLAYDVLWEKSDIDMTLVVREQALKNDNYCIIEDGIIINVYLMQRSSFKRGLERNIGGSFSQSYFSKSRIVYSTDDSLYEYFEDIKNIGGDDIALSAFYLANRLIYYYEKSQKWLRARRDHLYAQYFLITAADTIANMELCLNGEPGSRESIQKALKINPDMIAPFYQDAMSHHMSEDEIIETQNKIDDYIMEHIDIISRPVIEFMSDQQIKTSTLISKHFNLESHFIISIFDYLADKGVIERVSQTIRITPKGRPALEELGYLYIPQ